jgi:hypothetical protein
LKTQPINPAKAKPLTIEEGENRMGDSSRLPPCCTTQKFPCGFVLTAHFYCKNFLNFSLPYVPVIPQISPVAPFRALESRLGVGSFSETAV